MVNYYCNKCAILVLMEPQEKIENTEGTSVPQRKIKISTSSAIITAGVLIAVALFFSGRISGNEVAKKVPTSTPPSNAPAQKVSIRNNDYVSGDLSKAQVVIVEYSDSDCPYCQRFHSTMKEVLSTYGTKVAWVYRFFPLSIHPNAQNEAIALECVGSLGGNDKFWKFLDQIIDITVSPDKSTAIMTSTATSLDIDSKLFTSCLSNKNTLEKITDQSSEAQSYGAQGTPYSIAINKSGQQVAIPGAYPIDQMKNIIDGLMK